ncbi:MAG: hypothetical protein ACD_29C00023G0010 [uncultured bacterium]|nr:MAG: hypothetical protein ACD_29C00023G0010 [uncultured bacterium]
MSRVNESALESRVINWAEFRNAMIRGSENYLAVQDPSSVRTGTVVEGEKAKSGFFHSTSGIKRAENLKQYAEIIDTNNHHALFALLFATLNPNASFFESRSTWLAMCTAQQLITGEYKRDVTAGAGVEVIVTDNLGSSVFASSVIEYSKENFSNTETQSICEFGATYVFNHLSAVREIVMVTRSNMSTAEMKMFDNQVGLFKRALTQPSHLAVDMSIIPASEMKQHSF